MNDQWIPGPPVKPPTWVVNPLPPANAWDQTEGCATSGGPAIVDGITITGVPATVSSLYWQVSLNDGSSPPNFQINQLDGKGSFVSTAVEVTPTTINFDYPVLLSRDPVESMEPVTLEYLETHSVGIPEPPDNQTYGRTAGAWNLVVPASGGTFTGVTNLGAGGAVTSGALQFFGTALLSMPAVAQLKIGDGSAGQVPTADGSGNLTWTTPTTGGPYLPIAGGTVTGSLTVNQVLTVQGSNSLVLNAPVTGGSQRGILATAANVTRWQMLLGDGTAEGANNAGANFNLSAYSVTGGFLGNWLTIARADGSTTFNGSGVTIAGGLAVNGLLALASPNNLAIYGGSSGQVLSTNGSGVLSWTTPATGGIADAPNDGTLYGRKSLAWSHLTHTDIADWATAVPPAYVLPTASTTVLGGVRVDGSTITISGGVISSTGGSGGGIADAPNDGTAYARKSAAWAHLTHTDITDWTATLAPYALTANVPAASTTTPLMNGTAAVGTGTTWARADHVHPVDTSRYAASNPSGYQTAAQVTAALPVASTTTPSMNGTAAAGAAAAWSRGDHVHPSDTSRLALSGGTITGVLTLTGSGQNINNGSINFNQGAGSGQQIAFFNTAPTQVGAVYVDYAGATINLFNSIAGTVLQLDPGGDFLYANGTGVASKVGGGSWTAASDERIKTVLSDYKGGLDEVLQLDPVVYVYKGNDGPAGASPHAHVAESGTAFVGLIAQAAEAILPGMVTKTAGIIDGVEVEDFRQLDATELVFALVNAVKTLAARVAELEAAR
jgi:hypothetical protein